MPSLDRSGGSCLQYWLYRSRQRLGALQGTGLLPLVTLAEIATIQQGLQFRKGVDELLPGTCRLIQIRDFDEQGELREDWESGLFRFHPPSPVDRYLLKPGDVLFLARGLRNFAWAVPAPMPEVVAVGYFLIIRPDAARINPGYLAWYLNSEPTRAHLRNVAAQGILMPVVSRAAFQRLSIPLPPLAQQAAIAELEALRRREVRLLHRLKALRQSQLATATLRAANRFDQISPKGH